MMSKVQYKQPNKSHLYSSMNSVSMYFSDYGSDVQVGRSKYSRSALSSYKPIGRVPVM